MILSTLALPLPFLAEVGIAVGIYALVARTPGRLLRTRVMPRIGKPVTAPAIQIAHQKEPRKKLLLVRS